MAPAAISRALSCWRWRMPERPVPRETPDPLDPFEHAVAFAIREARRLRREATEHRAKMTVVQGGKREGGEAA